MATPTDDRAPRGHSARDDLEDLEAQVDRLIQNVEALAGFVSHEAAGKPAPAAPARDPTRELAADDRGLAAQSPLIPDGQRIEIDEIVADVELTLDRARRDLQALDADSAPLALSPEPLAVHDAPVRETEPGNLAPDGAQRVDSVTADADRVLDDLERLISAAEHGQDHAPSAPAAPAATVAEPVRAAAEEASDVLADMEHLQTQSDDLGFEVMSHTGSDTNLAPLRAASALPGAAASPASKVTAQVERELGRIENLLDDLERAGHGTADGDRADPPAAPAPGGHLEPADDATAPVQQTAPAADRAAEATDRWAVQDTEFESSTTDWRLIQISSPARSAKLRRALGSRVLDPLIRALETADGPFRKLTAGTKELLGYCALATLAMSLVALLIWTAL